MIREERCEPFLNHVLIKHPGLVVKLLFTDDIMKDSITLCENKAYKQDLIDRNNNEGFVDNANGRYLFPENIDGTHYILISNQQIEGDSYISTAAHECQHILDYVTYCKNRCNGDFYQLLSLDIHPQFKKWSEYNAGKASHKVYWENRLNCAQKSDILHDMKHNLQNVFLRMRDYLNKDIQFDDIEHAVNDIVRLFSRIAVCHFSYRLDIRKLPPDFHGPYNTFVKYRSVMEVDYACIKKSIETIERKIA